MHRDSVALLAEGVDRNYCPNRILWDNFKSPSSRRAWIEIETRTLETRQYTVALLAEGVDRNVDGCY